jgi:hypothetical protein
VQGYAHITASPWTSTTSKGNTDEVTGVKGDEEHQNPRSNEISIRSNEDAIEEVVGIGKIEWRKASILSGGA